MLFITYVRIMFYIYRGEVWVTPAGQTVPEYIEVRAEFPKERSFAEVITYLYYTNTKKDNPYWGLPMKERKHQVVSNYNLFSGSGHEIIDSNFSVQRLLLFYRKINLTENELNEDAFRAKSEYWRNKLMDMENTPDLEESYAKALAISTKLAQEFKIKSEIDDGTADGEGAALYLFEIPEDKKPHHQRMKL